MAKAVHPWFKQAMAIGKLTEGWYAVEGDTEQASKWAEYFRNLGWTPWTFLDAMKRCSQWTAPAQWPEWIADKIDWKPEGRSP